MCFFVEKLVWEFVKRTRKSSHRAMTTSFGCFCLHSLEIREDCFGENKKIPAPGTQEEDFVLPRISRPLQNGEVPDKISFSSFLFGLTTDFFGFIGNRRARTRFCLSYQEEDGKISGVFNLRMKRLRMCFFAPNRRLMTIDDVLFTSPSLSCDLIETS
jgi:hypothetical protein